MASSETGDSPNYILDDMKTTLFKHITNKHQEVESFIMEHNWAKQSDAMVGLGHSERIVIEKPDDFALSNPYH